MICGNHVVVSVETCGVFFLYQQTIIKPNTCIIEANSLYLEQHHAFYLYIWKPKKSRHSYDKRILEILWETKSYVRCFGCVSLLIILSYLNIIISYPCTNESRVWFLLLYLYLWYRCVIRTRLYIGVTRLCIKVIASSDISAWVVDTFRKVAISRCSWYISRGLDLNHLYRLVDFIIHRAHILREVIWLFWRDYIQICFTAAIWKLFKGFITRLIFMFFVRSKGFLFRGFDFFLISITIMKRTIKITAPTPASR